MNSIWRGNVTQYTILRPYISDIGAATIGPSTKPNVYKERGRRAISRSTWNFLMIIGTAGLYAEVATVLEKISKIWRGTEAWTYMAKPYKAGMAVWRTFFDTGQF